MKNDPVNWKRVYIKGIILFGLITLLWPLIPFDPGAISLYNRVFPGRERLPFGEAPSRSYNLSVSNLSAMIGSHVLAAKKNSDEYRVIILGDSSVWGILLKPEETLAGLVNGAGLVTKDGRKVTTYNLGYPSMSLVKDTLILERAYEYDPDLIIWLVTLESFPWHNQVKTPVVSNNMDEVMNILPASPYLNSQTTIHQGFWNDTLVGRRREYADLIRLQLYGVLWAATGIDQDYPEKPQSAMRDFDADNRFYDWNGPEFPDGVLAFDILTTGIERAQKRGIPVILVNEPILISEGNNSTIRYNYYYPRWAYDQYRQLLQEQAILNHWNYQDYWNLVPQEQFTNTAIHLSREGEEQLARAILPLIYENNP